METKTGIKYILPVLFGFFVMGFCDVVGIATSYVQRDFGLTETVAGFIPSMVFFWFLILSVPVAILMNRFGRKTMVQVSNVITIVGMALPFFVYTLPTAMLAFALLGIGNTILQVSLNPLLTNVVSGDKLTSSLTAGQVVKAVSSFCGPIIAAFALNSLDNWQYIFPIFAAITVVSSLWLMATPIAKEQKVESASSLGATFSLLKDPTILLLFFGIVFVVGTDVGMNTLTPKLLMERCDMAVDQAGFGSSVYFVCRTVGAFIGAFLLAKMSSSKYYIIHILTALVGLVALIFAQGEVAILALVGLVGFACSSIFAVIYSMAISARPEKANEISGLMITGVFGGAVAPPLMGIVTDVIGNQTGSIFVIIGCVCYLTFCAFSMRKAKC
ncbi:MAG: MFS transporter [Rikenellaceae bacterium]